MGEPTSDCAIERELDVGFTMSQLSLTDSHTGSATQDRNVGPCERNFTTSYLASVNSREADSQDDELPEEEAEEEGYPLGIHMQLADLQEYLQD